MWLPAVVGNGYEPLSRILDAGIAVDAVIVLVIAKMVATSGSVASGIPGGIFTPMLLVGAALGAGWATIVSFAPVSDAGSYALVGMAAATAASIHAPLTASVMVFELSGDYLIVLPLVLATVIATAASKALGDESVYETELRETRFGLGDDTRRPASKRFARRVMSDVGCRITGRNRRSRRGRPASTDALLLPRRSRNAPR
jgi:CIC family chloride channel protein